VVLDLKSVKAFQNFVSMNAQRRLGGERLCCVLRVNVNADGGTILRRYVPAALRCVSACTGVVCREHLYTLFLSMYEVDWRVVVPLNACA